MSNDNRITCPENGNSTDCLLRQVLQALERQKIDKDSEYNWNPINFGFTVPIGIFAAIFALIASYQAILAAGVGRRKCNRKAIGKWGTMTRRRWSLHELQQLSIATTPILTSTQLSKILEEESVDGLEGNHATGDNHDGGKCRKEPPVAMWLRLLEHGGLQNVDLSQHVATTMADYLPSDLLAVPAYAEVGLIISIAAVMGAHSFETGTDSPYPVVLGDGFQFDFRQHPTLGTIGAYSRYGDDPDVQERPTKAELATAIQHSRGRIGVRGAAMGRLHISSVSIESILSLDTKPHLDDPVSYLSLSEWNPMGIFLLRHACSGSLKWPSICHLERPFMADEYRLLWLLASETPQDLPAIFPSSLSGNGLSMLAMASKLWSTGTPKSSQMGILEPIKGLEWGMDEALAIRDFTPDALEYLMALSDPRASWKKERKLPEKTLEKLALFEHLSHRRPVVFIDVFRRSFTFLHSVEDFDAWFQTMQPLQRLVFLLMVLVQLQQLDRFLLARDAGCITSRLYTTTLALLRIESIISDKRSRANLQTTPNWEESLRSNRWSSLNMSFAIHQAPISRHLEFLQILDCVLESPENSESQQNKTPFLHLRRDIDDLLDMNNDGMYKDEGRSEDLLNKLKETIQDLYVACQGLYGSEEKYKLIMKREPTDMQTEAYISGEENVSNILIWRAILLSILFQTAPDNSDALTSGLWEHVIPIL
ncbi:hypothetical protein F53441_1245 [Fusarium austroafricanum]|uniref:Uncharacterized protein n=1 Tax=Fusarium austroafricanum TaxID=2364996 RepID=A0A8H4NZ85_9HYPO|nr:hypothetical protein F53441_1245 [Fusarium austroafricanum]